MPESSYCAARKVGDVLVIEFQERAGFAHPEVVRELSELLADSQLTDTRHMLVDCGQLGLAGSMFLESLIQLHRGVQERGGNFALCSVNDDLREILSIARFDTLWHMYASAEEGLQALTEGGGD